MAFATTAHALGHGPFTRRHLTVLRAPHGRHFVRLGRSPWHGASLLPTHFHGKRLFSTHHRVPRLLCQQKREERTLPESKAVQEIARWSDERLLQLTLTGPLSEATPSSVKHPQALPQWRRLGELLVTQLGIREMSPDARVRIFQYYLPLFFWMRETMHRVRKSRDTDADPRHGVIIGIQCPQGGGKTTLTTALERLFHEVRLSCAVLSIDDFYWTRAQQQALADSHRFNPLLQMRGNPGTHDIELAMQTLTQLVRRPVDGEEAIVAVPRYDKSAYNGRGDRAPAEMWPRVHRPVDVVLLEGWCLGFRPLPANAPALRGYAMRANDLVEVNQLLQEELSRLYAVLDAFVVIGLEGDDTHRALRVVYDWRLQAEQEMRAQGKDGMTDDQVRAFVDKFMPAYHAYLQGLYDGPPLLGDRSRELRFRINRLRQPTRRTRI